MYPGSTKAPLRIIGEVEGTTCLPLRGHTVPAQQPLLPGRTVLEDDREGTWSEWREPSRKRGKTAVDSSERFCSHASGVGCIAEYRCLKWPLLKLTQIYPVVFGLEIAYNFLSQKAVLHFSFPLFRPSFLSLSLPPFLPSISSSQFS